MSARARTMAQSAAVVFVGGYVGSLVRIVLEGMQPASAAWPWMTMIINLTGAFLLGFLLEFLAATGADTGARRLFRLAVGTGVMGGYTTYGTFVLETDTRLLGHAALIAGAYAITSILLGLLVAAWGISAGGAAGRRFKQSGTDDATSAQRIGGEDGR
ncbi:CrcB family protein [uncultured Bifidobacterium sp.]|uniref:fluoride efflux transporter FluC n=1 Tax=uncultured Bifidobacterium sp. TaxID=165187 RepID=UPI002625E67C|nr:CrcB family protein [uncultured Bifidobacterium sp.]